MNLPIKKECLDPEREAKTYLEDMIVRAPGHEVISSAKVYVDEFKED